MCLDILGFICPFLRTLVGERGNTEPPFWRMWFISAHTKREFGFQPLECVVDLSPQLPTLRFLVYGAQYWYFMGQRIASASVRLQCTCFSAFPQTTPNKDNQWDGKARSYGTWPFRIPDDSMTALRALSWQLEVLHRPKAERIKTWSFIAFFIQPFAYLLAWFLWQWKGKVLISPSEWT